MNARKPHRAAPTILTASGVARQRHACHRREETTAPPGPASSPAVQRKAGAVTAQLTSAEASALDAIDESGIADHLQEVLAVPSVTGSPAESELQHLLA